jgi:hypothetical protein
MAGVKPLTRPAEPTQPATKPEPDMDKIDLSKASRPEIDLLNVMLMKEVYLKEALASGVGEQFAHSGCAAVFHRVGEAYRLMPSKFDTLSAWLADQVRPVETITRHLTEPYANLNEEAATKLLQDCIKRVKSNYLRSKSKELVSSLRGQGEAVPSDQLEQIMNIHRNRRSLNRDS